MQKFVITGTGHDRPGLVAALTQSLLKAGCNLEDSSMTRLAGEFAVIVIASGPVDLTAVQLQGILAPLGPTLGFHLTAKRLTPVALSMRGPEYPWLLRVSGADRTGITYEATRLLADRAISITDLHAQQIEGDEGPVYLLMVECLIPAGVDTDELSNALKFMAARLSIEAHLAPINIHVL